MHRFQAALRTFLLVAPLLLCLASGGWVLAQEDTGGTVPGTASDLFGLEPAPTGQDEDDGFAAPGDEEALFGMDPGTLGLAADDEGFKGFIQFEGAYTFGDPEHWSKLKTRIDLYQTGGFANGIRWRAGVRGFYDPVFEFTDFYKDEDDVRDDQRLELKIHETYLDIPLGNWELRIGRQNIVWGEMVALLFADVVSPLDTREFLLPDFELQRIPQWAVRAEYFKGNFHGELIWIPIQTYDEFGEPGSDFFPFQAAGATVLSDDQPVDSLDNMGYGIRGSYLLDGLDIGAFVYTSMDHAPVFKRETVFLPQPGVRFRPVHKRIYQFGATMARGLGRNAVIKGEFVYTRDKPTETLRLSDPDGLIEADIVDYIIGLNISPRSDTRLNFQFFQRRFQDYDKGFIQNQIESGATVLWSTTRFASNVEPEIILIRSLERADWNLQARVSWDFQPNMRLVGGFDVFKGPQDAAFGRFDDQDRVYMEYRYSF